MGLSNQLTRRRKCCHFIESSPTIGTLCNKVSSGNTLVLQRCAPSFDRSDNIGARFPAPPSLPRSIPPSIPSSFASFGCKIVNLRWRDRERATKRRPGNYIVHQKYNYLDSHHIYIYTYIYTHIYIYYSVYIKIYMKYVNTYYC